ncbi:hypothetical protein V5799_000880 [Amblyomma americanum]|uniref:Uncharacterized protein n=1 Tax=Amblyomma americanum TaxID=6943 RepID=A0AAQ4D1S9_AMBAM
MISGRSLSIAFTSLRSFRVVSYSVPCWGNLRPDRAARRRWVLQERLQMRAGRSNFASLEEHASYGFSRRRQFHSGAAIGRDN